MVFKKSLNDHIVLCLLILSCLFSIMGCSKTLKLAETPFEPEAPLSRIRPIKTRIIIPAPQGKENSNIASQESWTKLLALVLASNGHEVAVGGPISGDLAQMATSIGIDSNMIYSDRGDSDLTMEVKGYTLELFAVDFPYGEFLSQARLTVEIRLRGQTEGVIRHYEGYSLGHSSDLSQAQQWCVWDLSRDPDVVSLFTKATVN